MAPVASRAVGGRSKFLSWLHYSLVQREGCKNSHSSIFYFTYLKIQGGSNLFGILFFLTKFFT